MRITLLTIALVVAAATSGPAQDEVQGGSSLEYRLRPGDIVAITVWQHEEFSGLFLVNELGQISYPMLGDIDLKNMTLAELRQRIRTGLEGLFQNPFVTVTPLFRMNVLGYVQRPGLYSVNPTLTVLDVIAMAGGPLPSANMRRIQVLRDTLTLQVDYRSTSTTLSLQEIGARSGDRIYVPRKFLAREDFTIILALLNVGLTFIILLRA